MSKTKPVTITLTEGQQNKAKELSIKWNNEFFGKNKENLSGYIAYLINKADKEVV